jgi:hypothetical protein
MLTLVFCVTEPLPSPCTAEAVMPIPDAIKAFTAFSVVGLTFKSIIA